MSTVSRPTGPTATVVVESPRKNILYLQEWVAALKRLGGILQEYMHWSERDTLSTRLVIWIRETLEIGTEYSGKIHAIDKMARQKIEGLIQGILINELDNTPLRDPKLDQDGTIWENEDLQSYLMRSPLSSKTGQPMRVIDHLFAQAMLQWIKETPVNESQATHSLELVPIAQMEITRAIKEFALDRMAECAMMSRALVNLAGEFTNLTNTCITTIETTKAEHAAEKNRAEKREIERTQALETRVTKLQSTYDTTLATQDKQLQKVTQKATQLDDQLVTSIKKLDEQGRDLKDALQRAERAEQTVNQLRDELANMDDDGGLCTIA